MSDFAVLTVCLVVLVIFIITLVFKGFGFILNILTTPKKLITLMVVVGLFLAAVAVFG